MEIAGHRSLALLVMIGTLSGCAELPVPTRAPFTAAPRSSSAPWQAPPRVAADRSRALASLGEPIDPDVVYGLAALIDFAHRATPEPKRASAARPGDAAGPPPVAAGASPRGVRGGGRAGDRERCAGRARRKSRHPTDGAHARGGPLDGAASQRPRGIRRADHRPRARSSA